MSSRLGYNSSISACFYKYALSSSDPKGSPFESKTIERTLSVELSGTAGKYSLLLIGNVFGETVFGIF